jgi:ABC-type hemin transport system substrate-binding protein
MIWHPHAKARTIKLSPMGLEETVAKKIDRIAQMLNCPEKGEELRRAITESRKEFLLAKQEEAALEEEGVLDDELIEDEDDDDEYDEFDWTTE